MKLTDMTFHEQYGEVSVEQLKAYKKHNVSPSDHDDLCAYYGESAHAAITEAVKSPFHQIAGGSFSTYKFFNN